MKTFTWNSSVALLSPTCFFSIYSCLLKLSHAAAVCVAVHYFCIEIMRSRCTFWVPYRKRKKLQHGCRRWAPQPQWSQCPGVPLSWCPIFPVSRCPSVQVAQCPSPLGGTEKHTRGGRETHKEGGDGQTHNFRDKQTDRQTHRGSYRGGCPPKNHPMIPPFENVAQRAGLENQHQRSHPFKGRRLLALFKILSWQIDPNMFLPGQMALAQCQSIPCLIIS